MIEIEELKTKEKEKQIYNPEIKIINVNDTSLKVMRVELEEDYTRIDFVFNNGNSGWVQIDPNSFIRPVGSEIHLRLVKAAGIPLAPQKYFFTKVNQTIYYTLYFPAVPKTVKEIDIIEKETPGGNWFNFYGVSMEKVRTEKIIIGN